MEDISRETYQQFIERYIFTFSKSYVDSATCANFVKQKKNRDIQLTLSYLTRFDSYKKMCKYNLLWKHPYLIRETIESVRDTIANDMSDEDIVQIAELSFIIAQKKFNEELGIPFKNYLYHYYKWIFVGELKKCLWKTPISTDAPVHSIINNDRIESENYDKRTIEKNLDTISNNHLFNKSENQLVEDSIDWRWVSGETASWAFQDLSPHERNLIKLRYVDEMTWKEIAQMLCMDEQRIKEIANSAINKIKQALEE